MNPTDIICGPSLLMSLKGRLYKEVAILRIYKGLIHINHMITVHVTSYM